MKTAYFAAILALASVTVLACNDDEDRVKDAPGSAGSASDAGAGGSDGRAGESGDGGAGGDEIGGESGSSAGGAGGDAGHDAGGAAGQAGASGEGGDGGAPQPEPFELIGEYDNDFGGEEIITAHAWNESTIAAYDNDGNEVYLQLPADDTYNPSKFTKVVYTEPVAGAFYYCWVAYGLETLAAAQASTATADATDPATSGCAGFSWTRATPQ